MKQLRINIKGYLQQLKREEGEKPPSERRPVPTLTHLAEVCGATRQGYSKIANGETYVVNLDIIHDTIMELRRLGFEETDLKHMFTEVENGRTDNPNK